MTDAGGGPPAAHPDSLLARPDGSHVWLKVHRCVWSGRFAANSLDAVGECHRARVARAEIDLWLLRDADGIIDHDGRLRLLDGRGPLRAGRVRRGDVLGMPVEVRPALLSELVEAVRAESYPTRIEIDIKDELPWPPERVDEILGLLAPIRERMTLAGCNDETLRRLAATDGRLSIGFNPALHLDWVPRHRRPELAGVAGPDGWLDRTGAQSLPARLAALRSLVPTADELHLRLEAFERLTLDAATDTVGQLHAHGWAVDVWTLDVGALAGQDARGGCGRCRHDHHHQCAGPRARLSRWVSSATARPRTGRGPPFRLERLRVADSECADERERQQRWPNCACTQRPRQDDTPMALVLGGHDPPHMEPRRWASVATLGLLLAGSAALPAQTWAAPPNQLLAPTVSPRSGTPATSFVFSVTYEGRDPATSVVAIVGGQTVALALVSGSTTSGTYRGESQLPAGTWTVTFSAVAERGNAPTAAGGSVQVDAPTPIPTPIPAPTAPPPVATPAPTPPPVGPIPPAAPTPTPIPAAINSQPPTGGVTEPGSSTAPVPSSLDEHAGTPGGAVFSLLPSPASGAVGSTRPEAPRASDAVLPIMVGGLGIIAVVAASGLLLGARRRRQQPEAPALIASDAGLAASADKEKARASSVWELDAQLEDEKIGTVDYLPLENGEAVGEPPADLPTATPPKRVNPRAARIEAARSHRPASQRRSLLGRG